MQWAPLYIYIHVAAGRTTCRYKSGWNMYNQNNFIILYKDIKRGWRVGDYVERFPQQSEAVYWTTTRSVAMAEQERPGVHERAQTITGRHRTQVLQVSIMFTVIFQIECGTILVPRALRSRGLLKGLELINCGNAHFLTISMPENPQPFLGYKMKQVENKLTLLFCALLSCNLNLVRRHTNICSTEYPISSLLSIMNPWA